MIPRFLNRLAGGRTPSQVPQLLNQLQKRTYLTSSEYASEVPDHVKKALDKAPLPTQEPGSGTCRIEANSTRRILQNELAQYGVPNKPPTKSNLRWTDQNAERVKQGYPAVVDGTGTATKHSEWNGGDHHAVTVLSTTKDGKKFVAHDPDRTHHPKTKKAHEEGRAEPRHNLRTMTKEELESVRPRVIESHTFEAPTIEPVVEQGAPSSGGWFSRFFGK